MLSSLDFGIIRAEMSCVRRERKQNFHSEVIIADNTESRQYAFFGHQPTVAMSGSLFCLSRTGIEHQSSLVGTRG